MLTLAALCTWGPIHRSTEVQVVGGSACHRCRQGTAQATTTQLEICASSAPHQQSRVHVQKSTTLRQHLVCCQHQHPKVISQCSLKPCISITTHAIHIYFQECIHTWICFVYVSGRDPDATYFVATDGYIDRLILCYGTHRCT